MGFIVRVLLANNKIEKFEVDYIMQVAPMIEAIYMKNDYAKILAYTVTMGLPPIKEEPKVCNIESSVDKCPDCGKKVKPRTRTCPNCGKCLTCEG